MAQKLTDMDKKVDGIIDLADKILEEQERVIRLRKMRETNLGAHYDPCDPDWKEFEDEYDNYETVSPNAFRLRIAPMVINSADTVLASAIAHDTEDIPMRVFEELIDALERVNDLRRRELVIMCLELARDLKSRVGEPAATAQTTIDGAPLGGFEDVCIDDRIRKLIDQL